MRIACLGVMVVMALLVAPGRAVAFDDFQGTRSLALGGGLRGAAAGGSGPLLNPSGMSLVKAYTVEAAYGHSTRRDSNFFHGSIVDSTSGLNLAGGLYYTYQSSSPALVPAGHGHEVGLALAIPLGEYIALGATGKYFRLEGDQAPADGNGGTSFDIGLTARPISMVSLGVVGSNLRNLHTDETPRTVGYGAAFSPIPELAFLADGRTMLDPSLRTGNKGTSVMGGAEFFWARRVALRAGGGYDAVNLHGYLSGGLSAISEVGAVDVAVRRDLFSVTNDAVTVFAASLRLFVPQP